MNSDLLAFIKSIVSKYTDEDVTTKIMSDLVNKNNTSCGTITLKKVDSQKGIDNVSIKMTSSIIKKASYADLKKIVAENNIKLDNSEKVNYRFPVKYMREQIIDHFNIGEKKSTFFKVRRPSTKRYPNHVKKDNCSNCKRNINCVFVHTFNDCKLCFKCLDEISNGDLLCPCCNQYPDHPFIFGLLYTTSNEISIKKKLNKNDSFKKYQIYLNSIINFENVENFLSFDYSEYKKYEYYSNIGTYRLTRSSLISGSSISFVKLNVNSFLELNNSKLSLYKKMVLGLNYHQLPKKEFIRSFLESVKKLNRKEYMKLLKMFTEYHMFNKFYNRLDSELSEYCKTKTECELECFDNTKLKTFLILLCTQRFNFNMPYELLDIIDDYIWEFRDCWCPIYNTRKTLWMN